MKKIAILGGNGSLGTHLVPKLLARGFQVQLIGRAVQSDIVTDVTNQKCLLNALELSNPEVIVNLAANTDVEQCELNIESAYGINAQPNHSIRKYLDKKKNAYAVYTSTDHVYDSQTRSKEGSIQLINSYAKSKRQGELNIEGERAVSLRINFFGQSAGKGGKSFTDWILKAASSSDATLFSDVYFSPLEIGLLTDYMVKIILSGRLQGVYNLGSRNQISKLDFGIQFLNRMTGQANGVTSVNYEDLKNRKNLVSRPLGMGMDCTKFEKEMGIVLPTIEESIEAHYRRVVDETRN